MRRFLFEYLFRGDIYCVEIIAADATEACERIKALPWAQYKGEVFATIPATPSGLFRRLCMCMDAPGGVMIVLFLGLIAVVCVCAFVSP